MILQEHRLNTVQSWNVEVEDMEGFDKTKIHAAGFTHECVFWHYQVPRQDGVLQVREIKVGYGESRGATLPNLQNTPWSVEFRDSDRLGRFEEAKPAQYPGVFTAPICAKLFQALRVQGLSHHDFEAIARTLDAEAGEAVQCAAHLTRVAYEAHVQSLETNLDYVRQALRESTLAMSGESRQEPVRV